MRRGREVVKLDPLKMDSREGSQVQILPALLSFPYYFSPFSSIGRAQDF